ncbi:hypothetical protein PSTT_00574 [Puccinia striiformis]|uniref:NTF2 domain-containing protein n=1 Tax=Puccinia striiformis TaxID=27350 RepID=A0A2S4W6E2_9BASI|nr:hypothetical protein PSTT_00574 [Puccinia striiformis]
MNQTDRGSAPSARAIEIRANKHAELFVDAYYSVYDSSTRTNKLPEFYRPDARIVWNGNAIAGLPAFSSTLLSQLSYSKHEVQSFDAHAIPGSVIAPSVLPTITITISGQVIFSAQPFPSNFRMPDPKDISPKQKPGRCPAGPRWSTQGVQSNTHPRPVPHAQRIKPTNINIKLCHRC